MKKNIYLLMGLIFFLFPLFLSSCINAPSDSNEGASPYIQSTLDYVNHKTETLPNYPGGYGNKYSKGLQELGFGKEYIITEADFNNTKVVYKNPKSLRWTSDLGLNIQDKSEGESLSKNYSLDIGFSYDGSFWQPSEQDVDRSAKEVITDLKNLALQETLSNELTPALQIFTEKVVASLSGAQIPEGLGGNARSFVETAQAIGEKFDYAIVPGPQDLAGKYVVREEIGDDGRITIVAIPLEIMQDSVTVEMKVKVTGELNLECNEIEGTEKVVESLLDNYSNDLKLMEPVVKDFVDGTLLDSADELVKVCLDEFTTTNGLTKDDLTILTDAVKDNIADIRYGNPRIIISDGEEEAVLDVKVETDMNISLTRGSELVDIPTEDNLKVKLVCEDNQVGLKLVSAYTSSGYNSAWLFEQDPSNLPESIVITAQEECVEYVDESGGFTNTCSVGVTSLTISGFGEVVTVVKNGSTVTIPKGQGLNYSEGSGGDWTTSTQNITAGTEFEFTSSGISTPGNIEYGFMPGEDYLWEPPNFYFEEITQDQYEDDDFEPTGGHTSFTLSDGGYGAYSNGTILAKLYVSRLTPSMSITIELKTKAAN